MKQRGYVREFSVRVMHGPIFPTGSEDGGDGDRWRDELVLVKVQRRKLFSLDSEVRKISRREC